MSKPGTSEEQIAFNKKLSEIKKLSSVSCYLWGSHKKDKCSKNIISAHSIQRGKTLESIAENGKVYHLGVAPLEDLSDMMCEFKLGSVEHLIYKRT